MQRKALEFAVLGLPGYFRDVVSFVLCWMCKCCPEQNY